MTACVAKAPLPDPVITKQTILPSSFEEGATESETEAVQVPAGLFLLAEIIRPRAELREGPGVQFLLKDAMLSKGNVVLVFESHGVWRKVFCPVNGSGGWVHKGTLSAPVLNKAAIRLKTEHLPLVFAVKNVDKAFEFGTMQKISVTIPKGRYFHLLLEDRNRNLVWVAETNSVMWLAKEDAH